MLKLQLNIKQGNFIMLLSHVPHLLNLLPMKKIILPLHLQPHIISITIQGRQSSAQLLHHHIWFLLPFQNTKVWFLCWSIEMCHKFSLFIALEYILHFCLVIFCRSTNSSLITAKKWTKASRSPTNGHRYLYKYGELLRYFFWV